MPIPFPYPNIRSKLNRACAQYLIINGVGDANTVFAGNVPSQLLYPCVICKATVGKPEVPMSGIYRVQMTFCIRGSAVIPPNSNLTGQNLLDKWECLVGQVHAAFMQTDVYGQSLYATAQAITAAGRSMAVPVDGTPEASAFAAANLDMADLTVGAWYDDGFGDGEPDAVNCAWEEILLFNAQVCGKNVD